MTEDRLPTMGYWARAVLTVAAIVAVLAAAWSVRNILLLVLVAGVLAVGLDPQVRWLQRHRVSRTWAVVLIVVLSLGFLLLFAWLVIPQALRQVHALAASTPGYITRLQDSGGLVGELQARFNLSDRLHEVADRLPELAIGSIPKITQGAGSALFNVLTVAVLTIYFLTGLERGRSMAAGLLAGSDPERNARILDESIERIGGYVSGNLFISLIAGTLAFIVLEILHVPFASALGLWVAIADLIPGVGAMLGAIVCVIVALFVSLGAGIAVAVYFVVYQRFENYVILPRVMGKAIDLSAPAVIITLLIGSSLAGLAGALLALPVVATIKVIVREMWPATAAVPEATRRAQPP
ncbi:MAG TPA: AI-2E family transporter [Actinomycetota bacterium]|nr:AI-2E family transporter [Actinomycetota bacterium]